MRRVYSSQMRGTNWLKVIGFLWFVLLGFCNWFVILFLLRIYGLSKKISYYLDMCIFFNRFFLLSIFVCVCVYIYLWIFFFKWWKWGVGVMATFSPKIVPSLTRIKWKKKIKWLFILVSLALERLLPPRENRV